MFEKLESDSVIYFIACKDFIKIGRCKLRNLFGRKAQLQHTNPVKLKILGVIICKSEVDKKERDLHKRFKDLKHPNKWFRKKPELLDYIAEHAVDPKPYLT